MPPSIIGCADFDAIWSVGACCRTCHAEDKLATFVLERPAARVRLCCAAASLIAPILRPSLADYIPPDDDTEAAAAG